jgi:hypothetical protein
VTGLCGPFKVIRWGTRWSIEDVLDDRREQPRFDTEAEAAAEADQRNTADAARRDRGRPRSVQPGLFDASDGAA